MMNDLIQRKVNSWVQNGDSKYIEINRRIIYLDRWLFSDYEPALGPGVTFLNRLENWLENIADEDDQKLLFELIPHVFYVGREELNVLYREAYNTIFARWLVEQINSDFTSPTVLTELNSEIADTWFCPLTDSLRINQFYHINDIPGRHDHRPEWRSLATFGDASLISGYIAKYGIKRIVLLEDFIGNGGQVSVAVEYIVKNFPDIPVLVVPLIMCPAGIKVAAKFTAVNENVKIVPVLTIPENYFVHEVETENELDFFRKLHALAVKTYSQVANSTVVDYNSDPYGPFGYKKTGGVIVMHTNTPNNTLPLIHNKSATWQPLFKRHKRI